jgi:hypothetical protein
MLARPHKCPRRMSSCSRMMSPSWSWVVFLTGYWTWWKFLSTNRYSFVQRFQALSDSFCFSQNSLARFCLAVGSDPVGIVASPSPIRKCAGVSAAKSSPCVTGLQLTAASMLIKVVFSCSSVSLDYPNTFRRQCFIMPTICSHHPPHQAARGAINCHTIPLWARNWRVLEADNSFQSSESSKFAAWNVLTLSV